MAIQVEMWQPLIIEELYKSNEFLRYAHNDDEYVIGGKIVHIPQSGGGSGAERNRSTLPATVVKRTDTDITYALDEYTTEPTLIPNADTVELSYNKRSSVVREETATMMELVGDDMLFLWADDVPAEQVIPTTGAGAAATAPGATGDRKIITEADIRKAMTLFNTQNVPRANRYLVLPSNMLDQLMSDVEVKKYTQQIMDLPQGVITRLYGFNILERSGVVIVADDDDAKLPGTAAAVTDDEAALAFHMDSVSKAVGDVTMYDNYGRAEYYGDIFSFLVRAKGRIRRGDTKGVALIRGVLDS